MEFASMDAAADLIVVSQWAAARGARLERLEVLRPSLEATYLALTNGGKGS
jgi:hypothetical protein